MPVNILNTGGTVNFSLKESIGNAHLLIKVDLAIEVYNTYPAAPITLLPAS